MGHRPPVDEALIQATKTCLQAAGYAGLTTRKVAETAGIPLSQIHYHFGSKRGLVLSLLAAENERLVARQRDMYGSDLPLSERWELACDYLDEDLSSGYVRVLQEMIAAGWSEPEIAQEVRQLLGAWRRLLGQVATQASEQLGGLGPFTAPEVAALVGSAFLGAESVILLGGEDEAMPVRKALRKVARLLRQFERGHEGRVDARASR